MTYKACILAAGRHKIGQDRLVNPALIPINSKAIISYIVEKFPKEIEILIAVGYKKETIIDYLKLAHPDRKFTYVKIPKYEGPGTGPGESLLQCKEHLQCPFVLFTADTILLEEVPAPIYNWIGVAHVRETEPYATVKIEDDKIVDWIDKEKTDYPHAFIGTAGIHDYKEFWESLEKDRSERAGEIQVSNGLIQMMKKGKLKSKFFTWFDTGTRENLNKTLEYFNRNGDTFDFSKMDEFIYFVGDRVIKFYEKQDTIIKRVHRAHTNLKGVTPHILDHTRNFFAYKFVPGTTIYPALNDGVCEELLNWAHTHLWKRVELNGTERDEFKESMNNFYRTKTINRLRTFYEKTGIVDNDIIINDEHVPKLSKVLDGLDWHWLCDGLPGVYHGDCNFGNLVITNAEKGSKSRFVVIDWRQDMGGLVDHADIYYDLAKLYGGMEIHFELIRKSLFEYRNEGGRVYFDFNTTHSVESAKKIFLKFAKEKGYDLKKIKVLAAITFLNMAPLHHDPYNRMLYYFGRLCLHKMEN